MNNKTTLTANREYKSTVFAMLFKDRDNLLSLYNALNGSNYDTAEDLEIVTLENATYMAMKNDNSFLFDRKLYLYEHQSTPNPNMPLRDLLYVATQYEKLINKKSLYARSKVAIPNPHFVVFYNGIYKQPERDVLRLSDLYYHREEEPMLELKVVFLNINSGYNESLKESCRTLREYTLFVEKVRQKITDEDMTTETAMEESIQECIEENILRDFLTANRKEVTKMSIFEYDEEKELKLLREAEYQAGLEAGLEQGLERGLEQGLERGMEEGLKNSINNLMDTMEISLEQALDLLKVPEDKRKVLFCYFSDPQGSPSDWRKENT